MIFHIGVSFVFVILFLLIFALIVGPLGILLGIVQAVFESWSRQRRPFPFWSFRLFRSREDAEQSGDAETEAEVPGAESASATATAAEASASGQADPLGRP